MVPKSADSQVIERVSFSPGRKRGENELIIYGWGKQTSKEHGPTLAVDCPNCNNYGWWELSKVTTWITLFFIPVIPYESKRYLACATCGYGVELSNQKYLEALEINKVAKQFFDDSITESDYQRVADEFQWE